MPDAILMLGAVMIAVLVVYSSYRAATKYKNIASVRLTKEYSYVRPAFRGVGGMSPRNQPTKAQRACFQVTYESGRKRTFVVEKSSYAYERLISFVPTEQSK